MNFTTPLRIGTCFFLRGMNMAISLVPLFCIQNIILVHTMDLWEGGDLFDIVINTFSHMPPKNLAKWACSLKMKIT